MGIIVILLLLYNNFVKKYNFLKKEDKGNIL